jgi:beta-N-acetylhexosaminidase
VPRELLNGRSLAAAAAAVSVFAAGAAATAAPSAASTPTLRELVGQRLVVAMEGTAPDAALLRRIRAGEIGGVILFGGNVRNAPQVQSLVRTLRAAVPPGHPPLLVAVDQEGGTFRRLRWAPPALSAQELGRRSVGAVTAIGAATGRALRAAGIDVDLAPVADVPRIASSFIAAQGRDFSTDPDVAAEKAAAFARGLRASRVAATAKHFPGLGRAESNTDVAAVAIHATRQQLQSDLVPFRRLVDEGVPLVMLSNAVYDSLGPQTAAWSPGVRQLLRDELGFDGVTITDALEAAAKARRLPIETAAFLSARVGTDLLLLAGSQRESAAVFDALVADARAGRLSRASLQRSYSRIVALKRDLRNA